MMFTPSILAVRGSDFVFQSVQTSVNGTTYVLERVSDGARISVELVGRGVSQTSLAIGTAVKASAISAGVLLTASGEVIAFIPNEIGRALLHNEQLTN